MTIINFRLHKLSSLLLVLAAVFLYASKVHSQELVADINQESFSGYQGHFHSNGELAVAFTRRNFDNIQLRVIDNPGDNARLLPMEIDGRGVEVVNSTLIDSIVYFSVKESGEFRLYKVDLVNEELVEMPIPTKGNFQVATIANGTFMVVEDDDGIVIYHDEGLSSSPSFVTQLPDIRFGIFNEAVEIYASDSILFFTATSRGFSESIWRSDGTESGSFSIAETGSEGGERDFRDMVVYDNRLYFAKEITAGRSPLYRTTENGDGVEIVDFFTPMRKNIDPKYLQVFNDELWFVISDDDFSPNLYSLNDDEISFQRRVGVGSYYNDLRVTGKNVY